MTPPTAALKRCVGDEDAFAALHWGREPFLGEDAHAAGFADLLAFDDVDHLVTSTGLRAPAFRLVKDGRPLEPSSYLRRARVGSRPIADLADVGRVLDEFHGGATIVLQGLHRYWPPLAAFCRDLEWSLHHPVQANAYLTPPTSAGLQVHADQHDVFALQTHGRKQWVVYWRDDDVEPKDLTLEPGQALYLPRGTRHAARTVDEPSLHITVGVRATTWHDVARHAVDALGEDVRLADPLPIGYARGRATFATQVADRLRQLAGAVEALDPEEVADTAVEEFFAGRPPLLAGQLRDLLDLERITDESVLRRRPGTAFIVREGDAEVEVLLGDRRLRLPGRAAPALRVVEAADLLRPVDLAAHLDEPGRLVLARRLVREGALRIERDPA